MLSQVCGYAVNALGYLATAGGRPMLVKEIAEATNIPAPYLAKIVQTLARRGLVTTQRGVGGGVTLAAPPDQTTLYDVCVALDDDIIHPRCMLGTAACSDERACPAHKFWTAHRAKYLDYLTSMTLADIAAFETRRLGKIARAAAIGSNPATHWGSPASAEHADAPAARTGAHGHSATNGHTGHNGHNGHNGAH